MSTNQAKPFGETRSAAVIFCRLGNCGGGQIELTQDDRIITAGSCFAQHIGKALKSRGFNWYDAEPPPQWKKSKVLSLPNNLFDADAHHYGYGIFSFRTGNIYTTGLLRQWVDWALGHEPVPDETWTNDNRFYDPFRPVIEPDGFASAEEVRVSRMGTVEAVKRAIQNCTVFVFTMGLTERWLNDDTGVEYPMCPGTAAGRFDAGRHMFDNMSYPQVREAMEDVIHKVCAVNPNCRFLLTVSPVPLTATAGDKHVLVATIYSKSTLRAVAGDLAEEYDFVDYFPSFEIVSSFPYRGIFFDPNMRTVTPEGVSHVMTHLLEGLRCTSAEQATAETAMNHAVVESTTRDEDSTEDDDEIVCEEVLLEAFGNRNDR